LKLLLLFSVGLAWTVLCAYALSAALRTGRIAARVMVVDRTKRPGLFAVNLFGLWLALALGVLAMTTALMLARR
jgi:F0F1-type ATP synthase membrane subunit c/vacuolar-type H+-ATPase subunit K